MSRERCSKNAFCEVCRFGTFNAECRASEEQRKMIGKYGGRENFELIDECYKKDQKIKDLEAKLAESDEYKELLLEEKAGYIDIISGYADKCKELKQQLEEKDQAIENWKTMYESVMQTCNNDAKEIERLREQLHIANQETLHFQNKYFAENQIAIDVLNKVKEYADVDYRKHCYINAVELDKYIDQQIRVLKGEE